MATEVEVYPQWKRGNASNIGKESITDGNILITSDTEELFVDIDGKRLQVNDIIKSTESKILAITNPKQNKLYFATDKGKLYYYINGKWKSISGGSPGFVFEIRDDGCLYMICEDEESSKKFYIKDGYLMYKLDESSTEVNLGKVTGDNGSTYTHPTTSGNKHIPAGGSSGQILRWSADGTAVWGNDNNTTYTEFVKSGSGAKSGLVPAPSTTAGTTKYLREDGTWAVPTNTTYTEFVKSGSGAKSGLVPAPSTTAGTTKYLREDGTWQVPPGSTYTHPTTSGNKHIPSGGSSGQILRWSSDGTAAWGADNNTTYSLATPSTDGLMSKDDKKSIATLTNNMGGLIFAQDAEGKWGYKAPGADTVTPFKTGDGFTPLIGVTPSDITGTLWFTVSSGETVPSNAQKGAYIMSTIVPTDENMIWCDDGAALTINTKIPDSDTGEIGCFWIE